MSIKLPDASWINVNLVSWDRKVPPPGGMLVSTTLMALGAIIVSMLLVRWFTRPLTAVATAAKDFYRGKTVVPFRKRVRERWLNSLSHSMICNGASSD